MDWNSLMRNSRLCVALVAVLVVLWSTLAMPDMEKSFSIYCDAPGKGLGCVLLQDGLVVAYAS
jgi:hypothetical protein